MNVVPQLKKRIRELLASSGMTGADLARTLGVDRSNVSAFTNDERPWNPTIETIEKIAQALGVPVTELFGLAGASEDMNSIREELAKLRQDFSPLPNLPTDVVEALARLKPGQVDGLRAILKGFGVLEKATGEPGSAAR